MNNHVLESGGVKIERLFQILFKQEKSGEGRLLCHALLLNPTGHLGAVPETLLIVFPFVQEIVIVFFTGDGATATGMLDAGVTDVGKGVDGVVVCGAFVGATAASCESFRRIVGEENVKLRARSVSQPSFSWTASVATFWEVPSLEVTETVTLMGALVKLYKQRIASDRIAKSYVPLNTVDWSYPT